MKIGVLSDTHCATINEIPKTVLKELSRVNLVIHAGDYTGVKLIDELRSMFEFIGVYGNMDPYEIREMLPERQIFQSGSYKIGVIHPSVGGSPFNIEKRLGFESNVDIIIHGHSHRARKEYIGKILYFNPGSTIGKFPATYRSFGLLEINEKVEGAIIKF